MGKPVAGEVLVLSLTRSDLQASKRRPALVVADLAGDDLILCQITTQARKDNYSIALTSTDFEHGQLKVDSFIRANRLFTVDQSIILYSAGKIKGNKLNDVLAKLRALFS